MANKFLQTLAFNLTFDLQVLRLAIKTFSQLAAKSARFDSRFSFSLLRGGSTESEKGVKAPRWRKLHLKFPTALLFYLNRSTLKRLIYLLLEALRIHDISERSNLPARGERSRRRRAEKLFTVENSN